LRNARVKGEPIGSALADLNAAVQPDCHRPAVRANTLLNQAFGALAAGDVAQAQAALGAVDVKALSPQLSIWYRHAHAAMNLATGKADAALAAYLDMSTEPVEVGLELSWRTWLGRADAHAALNQTDRRIAALQAAERLLDSAIAEVPAQLGRSAFVIDRQRSARDLVGALVQAGRHQAALIAARRARARVWLGTERSLRADTPERAAALVAYRKARAALEADLAQDLTRTEAERVTARQNRRARAREAVQLLDAALEGGRAQELPARSTTHPSVLMHPVPSGWAIFVWQGDQLDVHSVRARPDEDDATLAQRVWQTVAPRVRAAGVVDLMPMGRLRAVDFHGLPDGSNALAASIEVRYALDLPPASPSTRQGVVVVADPRLDLPGAVVEGQAVKAAAGADAQLLRGDAATPAALTAALKTSRRLHYAGHGVFSEQALASQLPLANGTALTAADILAMPQVPVEVVLSGCETSKAGRGLVDTVGLAQAFLAAGAEAVIATTRRVKDTDAQALSAGLYGPNAPASLSKALHLAQKKLQASKADWQSFRVLIR
jgi:hypothetical protein